MNWSGVAPRGTPSTNASASSEASTSNHSPVFDQYRAWTVLGSGLLELAGGLEPGEHAHIVLGRRTSEDDGDIGHGWFSPPFRRLDQRLRPAGAVRADSIAVGTVRMLKGSGPGDRSRTARHRQD